MKEAKSFGEFGEKWLALACCRFRGHRDKVFNGTGEWKYRE